MTLFEKTYFTYMRDKKRKPGCSIKGFDSLVILKVQSDDAPNVQISQTLGDETYVLDFGDKLSSLNVSGVIPLGETCNIASAKGLVSRLYTTHRIGKTPVTMTIGESVYSIYATGKAQSISSESPELLNFSMSFLGAERG